jgi:hypothetical protein
MSIARHITVVAEKPSIRPLSSSKSANLTSGRVDPLAGLVTALMNPELYRITVSEDGLLIEALDEPTANLSQEMMM